MTRLWGLIILRGEFLYRHGNVNNVFFIFRSIYREMLFLCIMACGADNISMGKESVGKSLVILSNGFRPSPSVIHTKFISFLLYKVQFFVKISGTDKTDNLTCEIIDL